MRDEAAARAYGRAERGSRAIVLAFGLDHIVLGRIGRTAKTTVFSARVDRDYAAVSTWTKGSAVPRYGSWSKRRSGKWREREHSTERD
jgi:hypothetical protein